MIKLTRDITLGDIIKMSLTDVQVDTSDFSIDYHEMGCHGSDTIVYDGDEKDENIIKLWCLAIVSTCNFDHNRINCYIGESCNHIFDNDDNILSEAWKLAVDNNLMFSNFGNAIRQLGYQP